MSSARLESTRLAATRRVGRPSRSVLFLACVSLSALLTSTARPVLGAACSGVGDPYGECFVNFAMHPGEFPFAVTVIESEGRVAVADLFTGLFFKYNKTDIGQAPTFFFGPLGSSFTTGLAWHPTDDLLYWIINDGMGQMLVKSGLDGTFISSVPLASPAGGQIGDLTWNAQTSSFWAIDIEADLVFEFSATGVVTANSFPSPGLTAFGGGAYGTGITSVPPTTLATGPRFDMPVGGPIDLRAARVVRVNEVGAPQGLTYRLDGGNSLTGWITGIAYTQANNLNHPAEYVVNVTSNGMVEVKVGIPNPTDPNNPEYIPAVVNFTCTADEDGNVTLAWTNRIPYTGIEIRRDGMVQTLLTEASFLSPGAKTFMDPMLQSGQYAYEIRATSANPNPLSNNARCAVVVGVGRLLNHVTHQGSDALAITVVESTGHVVVADLNSGNAHRYTKDLDFVSSFASPFGTQTTSGLTWRSTSNTLFWFNADTEQLRETDLNGVPVAPAVSLQSPEGGAIGDIAYAALTNTFWGVDITDGVYFEFNANGSLTGEQFPFATLGLGDSGFGNGLTVVGDPGVVALDVIAGAVSAGRVDRVLRVITPQNQISGDPYQLGPTTLSSFINGIAWTSAGSEGTAAEYLVGNDTNTIYEVSLTTPGTQFKRGDVNNNGTIEIADVTRLLNFIFGINPNLDCLDTADVNDDGQISIPDVTVLLNGIFGIGATQPAPPFPTCGVDTTASNLTCVSYGHCP